MCKVKGGAWDSVASMDDPYSPYLCSSGLSSTACTADCESSVHFDWFSGRNISFFGSCKQYDICILDVNQSLCTANVSAAGGWLMHTDNYPKWMSYDWNTMSLVEGREKKGRCVLAYSNVESFLMDIGGNQTYVSSKEACVSFNAKVNNAKNFENVSGKWRPARSLRPGFMDTNATCKSV